ncbi:MAG: GGDEF domain-containing protein [Rhizobium sp.]|nr:GGDEF domain-containing protein [Rhizobium sp.]
MSAVTLDDVDRQLHRRAIFRFQAGIETLFVDEYARSRARMAPVWALLGLAMYLFQLNDDYNLTPDVFEPLLYARVAIFAPGCLIGLWLVMRRPDAAIRYDLLTLWVGVVGSLLPMAIASQTTSQHLFAYQNGNVGALMFFVIVLRPRFPVALIGLVLMAAIHLVTMALSGAFDEMAYTSIVTFVVTSAVFMAAGAFFLELTDRKNFLLRLRAGLLHEQLLEKSERDQLTGLLNRHSLARIRDTIWNGGRRMRSVTAILLDLDHFKLFNDMHGHLDGDECLRATAQCISRQVGQTADVFRFGGEEFLILATDTEALGALAMAERIRVSIEALAIRNRGLSEAIVTASLGVAIARPAEQTLEELLSQADAALYEAKRMGRNTVAMSPSSAEAHVA